MMLTTKSRYAVMAMVDIAATGGQKPMKLAEIAERQGIALNYLEQIFGLLKQAGLVNSVKGPGGGYIMNGTAAEINIARIVQAVDESVEMARCVTHGSKSGCMKESNAKCLTHDIWEGLTAQITAYLSSITLADVLAKPKMRTEFLSA